jgi:C-terminal processing protease CtpA/Prc
MSGPRRSRSRSRVYAVLHGLVVLAVLAGVSAIGAAPGASAQADDSGVTTLTGTVVLTDPTIIETFTEPYVSLIDMTGFVERNIDRTLPTKSQVTADLEGDLSVGATFSLALPIEPQGQTNDVAHGQGGDGVQVYSLDYQINAVGDPFLDRIEYTGWSTALTSLATTVDTGEVVGGQVVVWAPDDQELFPTGFGDDGLLFTDDDPVGPIPAGWTVVVLDEEPFGQERDETVDVPILEGDAGLKDLSSLSYTEAFDELVNQLRLRYPFTAYKGLDWDAIVAEIRPLVEQAEADQDALGFNLAMMQFAILMHDGHVYVDIPIDWYLERYGGGVGLYLGKTDDGKMVLRCVTEGSPAAEAGIVAPAEIVEWNGRPPMDVLAETEPIFSNSTAMGEELERLSLMSLMPVGTTVSVSYINPDSTETQTAELTAVEDFVTQGANPCGQELNDPAQPPVTVQVLDSGLGYIQVNNFLDDVVLMTHAWDWALETLNALEVPGLIVDMRGNAGGWGFLSLYFAGSFYDEPFVLNQAFVSDETGRELLVGEDRVEPSPVQWGKPVAVIVNPGCASACEIFAAAMAHNPFNLIVGRTPTAGVEAGVLPWLLPDDLYFQAPVIAFKNADGTIFLEGVGVIPNVPVPNTPENLVLSTEKDAALELSIEVLNDRLYNVTPGELPSPPGT